MIPSQHCECTQYVATHDTSIFIKYEFMAKIICSSSFVCRSVLAHWMPHLYIFSQETNLLFLWLTSNLWNFVHANCFDTSSQLSATFLTDFRPKFHSESGENIVGRETNDRASIQAQLLYGWLKKRFCTCSVNQSWALSRLHGIASTHNLHRHNAPGSTFG